MKAANLFTLSAAILAAGMLHAQAPDGSAIEPVAAGNQIPEIPGAENSLPAIESSDLPAPSDSPAPPAAPTPGDPATAPFGPR